MKIPEEWFKKNHFVYACATGNIKEIEARIAAGENINQIADEAEYVGGKLSGVGAAMATHRLDVLDTLLNHGADITKIHWNEIDKVYVTAFDKAIGSYFWQGVDHLIKNYGIPLVTRREDKNALLFDALPRPTHIHSFSPVSDPELVEEALRQDAEDRKNGIATIDYLIDELGLDINTEIGGMTLLSSANVHADSNFWGDKGEVLAHLLKRGCDPNFGATKTEPRFSVGITKEALEDLGDIFGESAVAEAEDDDDDDFIILGGPDTLHTSGLIGACYNPDPDIIAIYMADERSDPLHRDKHGNNAFDMLHMTRMENDLTKERVQTVSAMLSARVKKLYGYNYYDTGFTAKGNRPN